MRALREMERIQRIYAPDKDQAKEVESILEDTAT